MWWPEPPATMRCTIRLGLTLAMAGLVAGCFQPLYADRSVTGGAPVIERLKSVDVAAIPVPAASPQARVASELRNALIFDLTGGGGANPPTHKLSIQISLLRQQVIVDITTARPDVEQAGITASYTLTEIATGKVVVTGQTFSRVSFDNPGQEQRFARSRGQRDAENRAAKVISENIRTRLASYFIAGT